LYLKQVIPAVHDPVFRAGGLGHEIIVYGRVWGRGQFKRDPIEVYRALIAAGVVVRGLDEAADSKIIERIARHLVQLETEHPLVHRPVHRALFGGELHVYGVGFPVVGVVERDGAVERSAQIFPRAPHFLVVYYINQSLISHRHDQIANTVDVHRDPDDICRFIIIPVGVAVAVGSLGDHVVGRSGAELVQIEFKIARAVGAGCLLVPPITGDSVIIVRYQRDVIAVLVFDLNQIVDKLRVFRQIAAGHVFPAEYCSLCFIRRVVNGYIVGSGGCKHIDYRHIIGVIGQHISRRGGCFHHHVEISVFHMITVNPLAVVEPDDAAVRVGFSHADIIESITRRHFRGFRGGEGREGNCS